MGSFKNFRSVKEGSNCPWLDIIYFLHKSDMFCVFNLQTESNVVFIVTYCWRFWTDSIIYSASQGIMDEWYLSHCDLDSKMADFYGHTPK